MPIPAGAVLRIGYGVGSERIGKPRLVVGAGGEVLPPLVDAARLAGADSIFCGTLRRLAPEAVSLVVSSYAEHRSLPNHIVALKPSAMALNRDPNRAPRAVGSSAPPKLAAMLIGGDSGLFRYSPQEWQRLIDFLTTTHRQFATRWLVSTSPRSPAHIAADLEKLARERDGPVAEFVNYQAAGPGTLERLLARADCVVCTSDSSSMVSEAIGAQLPVVTVAPDRHEFKESERLYRAMLEAAGHLRSLAIDQLTPDRLVSALDQIMPMKEPPLERLAGEIEQRLPRLFN